MNYQQPMPRRRRSTSRQRAVAAIVFSVGGFIAVLVVVGAIAAALGKHHAPPSRPVAGSDATATGTRVAGLGDVVRDGDFAFKVTSFRCGVAAARAVNADGIGETVPAGAKECIATMTVTNVKGAAQQFFDDDQQAYDAAGRQFSADTTAAIYLRDSQEGTQVNPGITITALVPFQVPKADRIVKLVLHDSALSGGVTVRL